MKLNKYHRQALRLVIICIILAFANWLLTHDDPLYIFGAMFIYSSFVVWAMILLKGK